jgi:carbon-monoxide dehydrogenase large subunit
MSFTVQAGDPDAVFADAPRTMTARLDGRLAGNAMEPRGVLAQYEEGRDRLTVWDANARPHLVRMFISEMLGMPTDAVHVIGPDMGGSFGTGMFPEDVLIPFLARELRRPGGGSRIVARTSRTRATRGISCTTWRWRSTTTGASWRCATAS